MVRLRVVAIFLALGMANGAPAARASCIANPYLCIVPLRIVLCPSGDIPFRASMRSASNNPIQNCTGQLDFCGASGWVLAATGQPPEITFVQPCEPTVQSDVNGVDTFALRGGGSAPEGSIRLMSDGIYIRTLGLASPDQNGDLTVDARDISVLLRKIFAAPLDVTGDLNLDGHVNASDLALLMHHLGHHS